MGMKAHDQHDLDALDRDLISAQEILQRARERVVALRQTEVKVVPFTKPEEVPFGLFLDILETPTIAGVFSSWFRYGKINRHGEQGIVGAAHSVEAWPEDRSLWSEEFRKYHDDEIVLRPNGLDIALFGVTLPDTLPRDLEKGMRIAILGFPGGVTIPTNYEVRIGTAYMERDEDNVLSWIIEFDNGQRLAMGGMSGGVVVLLEEGQTKVTGNEEIIATLITQNYRADLGNGQRHSSDVTEMRDAARVVWRVAEADQVKQWTA